MTRSSSEETFRRHLPQALILLRKARGYTQQELTERVGIQQPVLCRYETGASTPTSARLAHVLHALSASWTELDLALTEVQRAEELGDTPSEKSVLESPAKSLEDLMVAFMEARQEGYSQKFCRELVEQTQYILRLQARLNLKEGFDEDNHRPADGEGRADPGDRLVQEHFRAKKLG